MDIRLLGPLEVVVVGRPVPLGGLRQRGVLAVLALRANHTVPLSQLIDEVWDDQPPGSAANTVQTYISHLRHALEPNRPVGAPASVLISRPGGYALRIDPEGIDGLRFERLVSDGRRAQDAGDHRAAARILRGALELWRGPALADFAGKRLANAAAARLTELRLVGLELRIDAELAMGSHSAAVPELQALLAAHPLRERFCEQLMLALYRSGQQTTALQAYRATWSRLVDELGVDPSTELQHLEQAILRHDPRLNWSPPERPDRSRLATAPPPTRPPPLRGAPAAPRPAPLEASTESRRVVTVASVALTWSASDAEVDPEVLLRVYEPWLIAAEAAITRHGGSIHERGGGALSAVFGFPRAHENDAHRAVAAMRELVTAPWRHRDAPALYPNVGCAAGIDVGEVIVTASPHGQPTLIGEVVDRAWRIAQLAAPGELLIGLATDSLLGRGIHREPGPMLRERGDRHLATVRVAQVEPRPSRLRRSDIPFIGRVDELGVLEAALTHALRNRACYLFTLLGPAGVGKSRLVNEFLGDKSDTMVVLRGHCPDYGEGITLRPMMEILRQAVGACEHDAADTLRRRLHRLLDGEERESALIIDRLSGLFDVAGQSVATEELHWAMSKLLETLARQRPLILVIDDLHWAEPALLDLVEHLADWTRDAPLLLCCMARPELLEERPTWGGGKRNASMLSLDSLTTEECDKLVHQLLGPAELPVTLRERIVETAGGNPRFAEEIVAMLVGAGRERGSRTRDAASGIDIPPTIAALLSARVDQLAPAEREALERASVIGRSFTPEGLRALLPRRQPDQVSSALLGLLRQDLISPDRRTTLPSEVFRFRQLLIRDAAYARLPKHERVALHQRYAEHLSGIEEQSSDQDAIVGHHLEQAARCLMELGSPEQDVAPLARRGAEHLAVAGRCALARDDPSAAVKLLARACALRPTGDAERLALLPDLAEALADAGESERAAAALEECLRLATDSGDVLLARRAEVAALQLRFSTAPEGWSGLARERAERARDLFAEHGDEHGMARAWLLLAFVHHYLGRLIHAEQACQQALDCARAAGDNRTEGLARVNLAIYAFYGPLPLAQGVARCLDLLDDLADDRIRAALVLDVLAALRAMEDDQQSSMHLLARANALRADLGETLWKSLGSADIRAQLHLLQGNPVGAERVLRPSYDHLRQIGETAYLSTHAAMLAQAAARMTRLAEAAQLTRVSETATASDDVLSKVLSRNARAEVLRRSGRCHEARSIATRTVALIDSTDLLNLKADTRMELAQALALGGNHDDATAVARQALDLYLSKGAIAAARTTRAWLNALN
jgi:predicted ATPase/DNA-binding SARP family transcriptional activator